MATNSMVLWQYLGSFMLYTFLVASIMYGVFFWVKRSPRDGKNPVQTLVNRLRGIRNNAQNAIAEPLAVEATLRLDMQQTLHILQAGAERFLISSSPGQVNLLAKLFKSAESVSPTQAPSLESDFSRIMSQIQHDNVMGDTRVPVNNYRHSIPPSQSEHVKSYLRQQFGAWLPKHCLQTRHAVMPLAAGHTPVNTSAHASVPVATSVQ